MSAVLRLQDNHFEDHAMRLFFCAKPNKVYLVAGTQGTAHKTFTKENTVDLQGLSKKDFREILEYYQGHDLSWFRKTFSDSTFLLGQDWTKLEKQNHEQLILFRLHRLATPEIPAGEVEVESVYQIETGNLMGVLSLPHPEKKDVALRFEVRSRFDRGEGQHFLTYLLSCVYDLDFMGIARGGLKSFLRVLVAILFVKRLGEAGQVGLYRQYRDYACNDLEFDGSLDLARHISENCPLWGAIAYNKRVISIDVPLNHLLRYAIECVERLWPGIMAGNSSANELALAIKDNTPSWHAEGLTSVLQSSECLNTVRHPYFREYYEDLRVLARMVIDEDGIGVFDEGQAAVEVTGVLFDGAWLWEEYLATVLKQYGFNHSHVGSGNGFQVFDDENVSEYKAYPDLWSESRSVVLDAKYKRANIVRSDIHELITYAFCTGATNVGLVFPPKMDEAEGVSRSDSFLRHGIPCPTYKPRWWNFQFEALPSLDGKSNAEASTELERFMRQQTNVLVAFVDEMDGSAG